jgi:hypothetical protein
MKNSLLLITFFAFMLSGLSLTLSSAFSEEEVAEFTVAQFVVSEDVIDREPAGVSETFSATTEQVFCFLEARDIKEDTTIRFVWYHGEKEMATVDLPLRQGNRWRTYSTKKLGGLLGTWKVELQNANGVVRETVEFTVD